MAKIIDSLTEEQKALIPEFRQKWVAKALNLPEKADSGMFLWERPAPIKDAERHVQWLYNEVSLKPPVITIEVISPYAMQIVANLLKKLPWDDFRGTEADTAIAARICRPIAEALVGYEEFDAKYLRDALKKELGVKKLPPSVTKAVKSFEVEYVPTGCIGIGHDAGWAAYYDYYLAVGGDRLEAQERWFEVVTSGIWDCILLYDVAIVCERPYKVRRDPQGRLHSLDSPALEWADGYKLYFVAGVNMSEKYYLDPAKNLTAATVLKQQNVEVRKGMIQIMGVENFIAQSGGEVVDEDLDLSGMPRRLIKLSTKDGENNSFTVIEVECPSKHDKHYLFVPPDIKRCDLAVAWTFGLDSVSDYRPILET